MAAWDGERVVLRAALAEASAGLVGREALVELVLLGAVAGEHLLVVGPPGTGKSAAVRRMGEALGGRVFEYLLGRFTEPAELFGPVDLRRLREGALEVDTAGMLPEADFVFLDELFLGSTAILNTLLGVLNEGRFRKGRTERQVPLRVCVAAANTLPEDPALAALADRFLLRAFVEPLPDARLEELLGAGAPRAAAGGPERLAALDALRGAAAAMGLGAAVGPLATAVRTLRAGGVPLSDRRVVRAGRLVVAAAVLAGREEPSEADLWPLLFAAPTAAAQEEARRLLPALAPRAEGGLLAFAAAAAVDGAAAHAARLVAEAARLPDPATGPAAAARVRGWLRDVDVAFAAADRPVALDAVRVALVARLGGAPVDPG